MSDSSRRAELYGLLGDLPPRDRPISVLERSVRTADDGYVIEDLLLDLNGIEPVPAYFVKPAGSGDAALPTVLYNHAHGGDYALGKDELTEGRTALQTPPYAKLLTDMGCAALCMDTWVFGKRHNASESSVFKRMIWHGQVLWGMMVYDSIRGIDYLCSRRDVDAGRLGTVGISMGSTMAWWVAALDERVRTCVDICCLTDFHALIDAGGLDGHGIYYYVPRLLRHFTTARINALIAPRAHLSLAGLRDTLTPPAGLERIDAELRQVYTTHGASERWKLLTYDVGHEETAEMRREIVQFLRDTL
ncbi:alpha/beta hydrolase [Candidatus Poribacteria bacterium]|nr:alpha/beta hydrolase [Candidatus Poribacteria bacterium]